VLTEHVIYQGLASTIFLAVERGTFLQVAIKAVVKSKLGTGQERAQAVAELEIHSSIPPHANVVQLLAAVETPSAILLVTPYTPCGDLWELTRYGQTYCEAEVRHCAAQMLGSIHHIHAACNLIHGDIKPHNFLLFNIGGRHAVQLCDFGLAEHPDSPAGTATFRGLRGTSGWFAPEMLEHHDYGQAVDLFGAGLILYRMLGGYPPFDPPSRFREPLDFDDRYWCHVSPACRLLLARLLALDPAERGPARESCEHEWLRGPAPAQPSPEQLRALAAFGPPPSADVRFWPPAEVPEVPGSRAGQDCAEPQQLAMDVA